jgi:hypothetical protein
MSGPDLALVAWCLAAVLLILTCRPRKSRRAVRLAGRWWQVR